MGGKTHAPYPVEYRHRIIELVRAGQLPGELAKEFEPPATRRKSRHG